MRADKRMTAREPRATRIMYLQTGADGVELGPAFAHRILSATALEVRATADGAQTDKHFFHPGRQRLISQILVREHRIAAVSGNHPAIEDRHHRRPYLEHLIGVPEV